VLVRGGDSLDPRALAQVATYLERDDPPDLIYADHDVLDSQGRRADPFLKPGWSPELLLSLDYIGPFVAVGRAAAEAALRICPRPIDTVYALLLCLVDEPLHVERIPLVLCTHGASHPAPPSPGEDVALREVARRRGRRLHAGARDERTGVRELRWEVEGRPLVSVVIPTTGAEDPLSSCLRSLRERTSYEALEVVLVDSGADAKSVAARQLAGMEHRVVPFGEQFNFSRACNLGAAEARGDFLLFLNDDTEALSTDWVERMLGCVQLPAVGVVGARLLFPEGLVQNGGLVLDKLPPAPGAFFLSALFSYLEAGSNGYHELLAVPRDCSAVTGACVMVPADVLRELGGWDEGFRMDFGDPDLCLRAWEAGYRVVLEPRAVVLHRESATQGYTAHDEYDTRRFLGRWSRRYADGDPWYHPACRFARDWELG
jgi:GT2 family glycosyltransferase